MTHSSKLTSAIETRASRPLLALAGDHWIEPLSDGTRVFVRPLQPRDREFEAEFIERLSPEARRFRFLCDIKGPSKSLLDALMKVDYIHEMAFVALVHDEGRLREIGVSRYATSVDGEQCECAITVADEWRHRGLALLLMRHLIETARRNGLRKMFAIEDPANEAMRELAGHLGFRCGAEPDDARLVRYTLDL
ncbi:MAG: GNAT family N-acetyltransferase [Rhodanobacter sp.]